MFEVTPNVQQYFSNDINQYIVYCDRYTGHTIWQINNTLQVLYLALVLPVESKANPTDGVLKKL